MKTVMLYTEEEWPLLCLDLTHGQHAQFAEHKLLRIAVFDLPIATVPTVDLIKAIEDGSANVLMLVGKNDPRDGRFFVRPHQEELAWKLCQQQVEGRRRRAKRTPEPQNG